MIASSSTSRPHPGRVIRDLFRQLHAVRHAWKRSSKVVRKQLSKGSCSLLVSGHNLRAVRQWCTLVPPLNCGASAALASGQALV